MSDQGTEDLVAVADDGAVRTISLNRPAKRNALSDALVERLLAALAEAETDADVRIIVLAGQGEHFCSGFDLKESSYAHVDQPLSFYVDMVRSMRSTYQSIWNNRKPVVAKVQGYCLAGGCYLQMLCDVSIAADDAQLGHPAVMSGGVSAMPLWSYYLGPRKAKEMLLTGKIVDGAEAERIGLINAAVPAGELDAAVHELTHRMAVMPPDAAALCKEGINTQAEIMGLGAAFRTHGHIAGLSRFGETDFDLSSMQRNAARAQ